MTEQSPTEQFHASSFLQGHNAEYIEQLYARYANDPGAVDASWQAYFKALANLMVSGDITSEGSARSGAKRSARPWGGSGAARRCRAEWEM